MIYPEPRFSPAGDCFLLVEFGDEMSLRLNFLGHGLRLAIEESNLVGVIETAPGLSSAMLHYNPDKITYDDLAKEVAQLIDGFSYVNDIALDSRLFRIPVTYLDPWTKECIEDYKEEFADKKYDPDLIVEHNGLADTAEFIRIHSSTEYWVASLGFWPGLPFLMPLDPRCMLTAPKYNPPRTWTPQGTIGLGGATTAIYPIDTPGSYQIFARTPIPIWNTQKQFPEFENNVCLFHPADRIKFDPCSITEFEELEASVKEGRYQYNVVIDQKFSIKQHEA